MSLDQRCQLFHDAAMGVSKSKGPVKEIATLRKFLHKNQDQRFTDKALSRLYDTIQIYHANDSIDGGLKEGLLEDALKMPFTVFNTKQKQKMLKWLEDLRGKSGGNEGVIMQQQVPTVVLSVIDLEESVLTLMEEDSGNTYTFNLPVGDLGKAIQTAFETTESVVFVNAVLLEKEEQVKQIISMVAEK